MLSMAAGSATATLTSGAGGAGGSLSPHALSTNPTHAKSPMDCSLMTNAASMTVCEAGNASAPGPKYALRINLMIARNARREAAYRAARRAAAQSNFRIPTGHF